MFDGFEYNSSSSCHFLRGKKQNFPFFSSFILHALAFSRSFSREKKKEKRIYRSNSAAGCCYIFLWLPLLSHWTRNEWEKKKEKKDVEFMHQKELPLTFVNGQYIYETENISHIRFSNTSCLCLEKGQLWYFFYQLRNKSIY